MENQTLKNMTNEMEVGDYCLKLTANDIGSHLGARFSVSLFLGFGFYGSPPPPLGEVLFC